MRAAVAFVAFLVLTPAQAMGFCTGSVRVTCVVDGDTFWLQGEKIRIADIDTPEAGGACEAERVLAARSAGKLAELLSSGEIALERQGKDRYGRTLATVSVSGISVSETMIGEHLARPWRGEREKWCP